MAVGCRSAQSYRNEADRVAYDIIKEKQQELGTEEPLEIETAEQTLRRRLMLDQDLPRANDASLSSRDLVVPKSWPGEAPERPSLEVKSEAAGETQAMRISLVEALQIGARYSREYQARKELIFQTALDLDLERNDFRTIFTSRVSGTLVNDQAAGETGVVGSTTISPSRRLRNGALLATSISFDVVKLLTGTRDTSQGIGWDASFTMPLLQNAGQAVVLEPLTQAERNVAYALLDFEQYKREFAVSIASQYLAVLSQYDQIRNAEDAYRRAIESTMRARRQADAGRLPEIQVDQSVQQELRSRERWIQAQANYGRRLDSFKILLGLPPDANIALDPEELQRMSDVTERVLAPATEVVDATGETTGLSSAQQDPGVGPVPSAAELELPPSALSDDGSVPVDELGALELALTNRPDLQVSAGRVFDAQRKVIVAASALQAGLTLTANASSSGRRSGIGAADSPDGTGYFGDGVYTGGLLLNLPLERTAERNAYRVRLIAVESAVRAYQRVEDDVKQQVRNAIRDLLLGRERISIQAMSVAVAEKRVASTNLFLDAGRAQIRDVLEAQDALVQAQNALTSALVDYRIAELSLQRDTGLLEVNHEGMWREYEPMLRRE